MAPLVPELEHLEVVEEELKVLEDLESLEVEDSGLLVENEEIGGCTSFLDSDNNMARVYRASQGIHQFSWVVGTIELEDFIIEFGAWCNGQAEQRLGFNPYSTWQAFFQHLEGAPMHDYSEFESKHEAEIDVFRNYWAPDFKNLFDGEMWLGSQRIGSRTFTIKDLETIVKEDGEGSSIEEKGKAKVSGGPKLPSILS